MCNLFKIRSKYLIKNILDYVHFKDAISIIQYNKKLLNLLEFTKEDIIVFLLMKKVIKPLANIEDYIPILKKSLNYEKNNEEKEKYLINLFCQYLNRNDGFAPNINFFDKYENMYPLINKMKITYNNNLIESFYDKDRNITINKEKLFQYANRYGDKIKEVSFLDSVFGYSIGIIDYKYDIDIISFLIQFSNINKIEDRYYEKEYDTRFLTISNSKNKLKSVFKDYKMKYNDDKNIKDVKGIINELKSYSLYVDIYNSNIIKSVCQKILINGENIEELEITGIKKSESNYFIALISLKVSFVRDS